MTAPRLFIHSFPPGLFGPALDPAALLGLSHRTLSLAGPDDAVLLESQPDPSHLEFLGSLGLGPGGVHVPADGHGTLAARVLADGALMEQLQETRWIVEPYVSGCSERQLAERLGASLHGSPDDLPQRANRKANLGELLERAGLPDVPTQVLRRSELERAIPDARRAGPVIVRADEGIGGSGVHTIRSDADLERTTSALTAYGENDLFLLQPLLDVVLSPNVQFDLLDSGIELVGTSEQLLLGGIHHAGNVSPMPPEHEPEVMRQGRALAASLHESGYRGFVGIDFIVTAGGEIFVIEINPRINTSTVGLLALGIGEHEVHLNLPNVPTPGLTSFADVRARMDGNAWYTPSSSGGRGIFPILPPSKARPSMHVTCVGGSREEAEAQAAALRAATGHGESPR